jgi:hypothetical protein
MILGFRVSSKTICQKKEKRKDETALQEWDDAEQKLMIVFASFSLDLFDDGNNYCEYKGCERV